MKVFISWSGERSRAVAEAVNEWLPLVLQAVDPWLSTEMTKGVKWVTELTEQLEESTVGIFCLTADNLDSPWLLFEAGAIAKTKGAHACTLLLDVKPSDIEPPLSLLQHTVVTKVDVLRLVRTINSIMGNRGERSLSEKALEDVFNTFWPRLEQGLRSVASHSSPAQPPHRDERQLLEELVELARAQERRSARERIVSRLSGLKENGTYVFKDGALRPINGAWIMKDGAWQRIRLDDPGADTNAVISENLGFTAGMRPTGGLLSEVLSEEAQKLGD